MKFLNKLYTTTIILALTATANAQQFETKDYRSIDVYDTWEASPFRTGQLQGNAAVCCNPYKDANNNTANVLALQRSRYGSNTFGARIDLAQPFELNSEARYIHVLFHKPIEGRVMLIGLGKRHERADQSPQCEQFWEVSKTIVPSGQWSDAVFRVKGAGGIDIYSLVVVPHCESPHNLKQDFVAYIDDIIINDDPTSRTLREDYAVNFDRKTINRRPERHISHITLKADTANEQYYTDNQAGTIYNNLTDQIFDATPGQEVETSIHYTGEWMHGYVYLDRNNDGKFTATLNSDGTPDAQSEVLSFSYLKGKDSTGKTADQNSISTPKFRIPEGLAPGYYRLRVKIDWDDIDPMGSLVAENDIVRNAGSIVDLMLNVHSPVCHVTNQNRNGMVLDSKGKALDGIDIPYAKPFEILMKPAGGFTHDGVILRYGYGISGDQVIHSNKQFDEVHIPASEFKDNKYTIPAKYLKANLEIEGLFIEKKK